MAAESWDVANALHRGLECLRLVALLQDALEHFVYRKGGHYEVGRALDGRGEELPIRPVGEVFEPTPRVDHVHIGQTGISSMRSLYWIA